MGFQRIEPGTLCSNPGQGEKFLSLKLVTMTSSNQSVNQTFINMIRNVLKRRRECGTYLATARRHRRRLKMQKTDE